MTAQTGMTTELHDEYVTMRRTFDAPREVVFRAWTEAEQLKQWWSPADFTTPYCTVDLRVGGLFHFCFRTKDGNEFWARGIYQEIVPPQRLVYLDSFSDPDGNLVEPSAYGISAEHPTEALVTVTFEEQNSKTEVTLTYAVPATVPERSGALVGWSEMFDKLATHLAA